MRTQPVSTLTILLATLSIGVVAACGDDDTTTAATTAETAAITAASAATTTAVTTAATDLPGAVIKYTGDFDSPYCNTARNWVAHDLAGSEPEDPAAIKAYFVEYTAFVDKATSEAPDDIAADWQVFQKAQTDTFMPLLERYGYDPGRIQAEGTDEEKAFFDAPPPDVQEAQENFHRFEAEVCHSGELAPADIEFTGEGAEEFCGLDQDPMDATPEELKEYFASGAAQKLADARVAAAPEEIKADVAIEEQWKVEQTPILLAAHGWDFAQVLREGTEEELIALSYAAPEVRDANARLGAYLAQVCEQ